MEQIFRVGDTVYHWKYGKGKVVEIKENATFPVIVLFYNEYRKSFTLNGSEALNEKATLSFEPYDLVRGGFTQIKPFPDIKKGTPIFVRDYNEDEWSIRVFSHFDEERFIHTFHLNRLSGTTAKWLQYSLENPINYEEESSL